MAAHAQRPGVGNLSWARTIIDELVRCGARHACVSPGARSAPLAVAVAAQPELSATVHVDERSAGYFALGYARAVGAPAIALCTSGTATANYLPAVVEAHYARVPLILLTADRPPELKETGAWQAIDQARLYGNYARFFVDLPVAVPQHDASRYLRSIAARAVASAVGPPAGPVHLNVPFREPLLPASGIGAPAGGSGGAPAESEGTTEPLAGRNHGGDWTTSHVPPVPPDAELIEGLVDLIESDPRGLLLAGPAGYSPDYAEAVAQLAEVAGYPLLADPAGGLRYGRHDRSRVVARYDGLLRSERWRREHEASLVLRFGQSFTWRSVATYLDDLPNAFQVIVDPQCTWDDPSRRAKIRTVCDPALLCRALADAVSGTWQREASSVRLRRQWLSAWQQADQAAGLATEDEAHEAHRGTVSWVYPALLDLVPDGALLYAANSMAIRDLDTFTASSPIDLRVIANRGAAGIDGTVSSALGAAFGARSPTVLVTGDQAFAHDLGGLAAARLVPRPVVIVVLNDEGGGIFAHLRLATDDEVFQQFFRAPPGINVAGACAAFGVTHRTATEPEQLRLAVSDALGRREATVIEVPLDLEANTLMHRRLWQAIDTALSSLATQGWETTSDQA